MRNDSAATSVHSLQKSLQAPHWLSFLWLEITEKCNLSCTHCYASSNPSLPLYGRMRNDDWIRVIKEGAALGCSKIQFIGGEPTLHPHLDAMILCARAAGYDFIEVFTNGTSLTKKRAAFYKKHAVHIACSFYSHDPVTHDRITTKPGSYERTLQGIETALEMGLPLRVGFIEMAENKGHYRAAKDFLIDLGVPPDRVGFDQARAFGQATAFKESRLDSKFGDLCGQCWKGKLCVTANGNAYPCIMARGFGVGNVIDDNGIGSILANATLTRFRRDMCEERHNAFVNDHQQEIHAACEPDGCQPDCTPENCKPCYPDLTPDCQPDICKPAVHIIGNTDKPTMKIVPDGGVRDPLAPGGGKRRTEKHPVN